MKKILYNRKYPRTDIEKYMKEAQKQPIKNAMPFSTFSKEYLTNIVQTPIAEIEKKKTAFINAAKIISAENLVDIEIAEHPDRIEVIFSFDHGKIFTDLKTVTGFADEIAFFNELVATERDISVSLVMYTHIQHTKTGRRITPPLASS